MATKFIWLCCWIIIIFSHYIEAVASGTTVKGKKHATTKKKQAAATSPSPPSPASPARELHLYYIRHVESQWNHNNRGKRDSRPSDKGFQQLQDLYDHFGNSVYDKMQTLLKNGDNYKKFTFEASTLIRAQLTALTAWKSLINKAEKATTFGTKIKDATFSIVQDLQEPSFAGIAYDAESKLEELACIYDHNTRKFTLSCDLNKPQNYQKYLKRGFTKWGKWFTRKVDPFETVLFSNGFTESDVCKKTTFVAGEWRKGKPGFWANRWNSMGQYKNIRWKDYGKRLRKEMEKKVELIIIGGHSSWFQHFVDMFGAESLKNIWGEHQKRVGNGHMVHVVVKPHDTDSIQIESIEELYPGSAPKPASQHKAAPKAEPKTAPKTDAQQWFQDLYDEEYDEEYDDDNDDEFDDEYDDEYYDENDDEYDEDGYDDEDDDEYDLLKRLYKYLYGTV